MDRITTYLSPGGQQHSRGDGPANRVLVGSFEGVATLERNGGSGWELTGRSLRDRHVGQLVYEPVSGKLFAGCHAGGGLWVSDDGEGKDWRQLTNGVDRPHIYALAARNIGDKVTLFAGTSPTALYRSDDLGETWQVMTSIYRVGQTQKWTFPPPPHIHHVKQIVIHPAEPETFFVLVEQGALLKTIDDGENFVELEEYSDPEDIAYKDCHRLTINPDNPDILWFSSGVGIYRSDDGGQNFHHLMKRGDRIGYCDFAFIDPDDARTVYQAGSTLNPDDWFKNGISKSCVMRSADNGESWEERVNGFPNPMVGSIQAMTQHLWDGGMMLFAGTATGEVYLSEDRTESWQRICDVVTPVAKDNHHLPFMTPEERMEPRAHMGR